MPLPTPASGQKESDFIASCMANETMQKEFPDDKQRLAVCYSQFRKSHKMQMRFESMGRVGVIDRENAVIHGVSILTEGEARGHDLRIDRTTLEQVSNCAKRYRGGVKVRLEHSGGVGQIVGALRSPTISDVQLLGNLHLLKSHPDTPRIMEMADEIPDTFGLSIVFNGFSEQKNGSSYARCDEIYACDLVSQPAANPNGLFHQVDTPEESKMSITELEAKNGELTKQLEEVTNRVKQFEADLAASRKETETARIEMASKDAVFKTQLEAKETEVEKRSAAKAQEIVAALGVPPVTTKPVPAAPAEMSYEQLWDEYHKIPDQLARREFYVAHEAKMKSFFKP